MTISFAGALAHAPGIVAWRDAAPAGQQQQIYSGLDRLRDALAASAPQALVVFTSEHWANFFLDHVSPFCIGRAEAYSGPVEPWLKIEKTTIKGDSELAEEILLGCYAGDVEPGFSYEMTFDHGTMIPLHFLTPDMDIPIVPIVINTLMPPQPSVRRCMELGHIVGEIARRSRRRIGLVATGGLSHDPGERNHGFIDQGFDRRFLETLSTGNMARLRDYTVLDFAAAGAVLAYEAVEPWATGIGVMSFSGYPDAASH
jgi:aromatic ring-opening dioxygenase catalytic subunit (LigB family)